MEWLEELILDIIRESDPVANSLIELLSERLELKCYEALKEIKAIMDDDELSDKECFERIERIVCVLESIGTNGGSRHDFG